MKQCRIQYKEKKEKKIPLLRKVSHHNKERTYTGNNLSLLCEADPKWYPYKSHLTCLCIFQVEKRRRHQKHSKAGPAGSSASFSAPRNVSLSGSGLPATDVSCSIEANCVARSSALSAYENTDGLSVCGFRFIAVIKIGTLFQWWLRYFVWLGSSLWVHHILLLRRFNGDFY